MVTTDFQKYLNSYLFSIALVSGVEVPALELTERGSEVAFTLADLWQSHLDGTASASPGLAGMPRNSTREQEEDEEPTLPWETPQVPLEAELQRCLKRVDSGEKFPARQMLDDIPVYSGLKARAEENNHGQDGKSMQDKMLKALQQRMLNAARVLATLYPAL